MKKLVMLASLALAGCLNMPTPPSQITGAEVSSLRYESFDCHRLAVEYDRLVRREGRLLIAQSQRVKTSEVQAFWWGFGQGDGIEAAELSQVRGEADAVRVAMEQKSCGMIAGATRNQSPTQQHNSYSPIVLEASAHGITLEKSDHASVQTIYDAASSHCQRHGKKSAISTSAYPRYTFSCL